MGKIRPLMIFGLFLFGGLASSVGQVLENYDQEVIVVEKGPIFSEPEVAQVVLDAESFPLADFSIAIPEGAAVFVDGVMWFFALSDTSFTVPVSTLYQRFPATGKKRVLEVYKKGIQPEDISIKKGFFKGDMALAPVADTRLADSREKPLMEQFFILAVLVVFFLISLFKLIYPLVLSFFVRPLLVFSTEDFSESTSLSKIFSEEVLFFLIIFNMLLMLLVMMSSYYLEVSGIEYWLEGDLNELFYVWLLGTGALLLVALVKFIWIKLSSWVFGIYKFEFVHFFYMLRIASLVQIGIFSILIVSITNDAFALPALLKFLLVVFFVVYILGILMLFLLMANRVSSKKYHIFSYLCTAELVPFLVLSKLIVG